MSAEQGQAGGGQPRDGDPRPQFLPRHPIARRGIAEKGSTPGILPRSIPVFNGATNAAPCPPLYSSAGLYQVSFAIINIS